MKVMRWSTFEALDGLLRSDVATKGGLTEEVRGPPEAFKSYKAGVMPKYQGAPFEPPNSGFI